MKNVPSLRFPEFNDNWKQCKLSSLGTFFKGSSLSKEDLSENGVPCILYGELYTKYKEVITKVYSFTNTRKNNLVIGYKNDVLIPSSGETAIDIACASSLKIDNVLLGGDLNVFRPLKTVDGSFISYQLNHARRKGIAKLAQGASVVHLYHDQLKDLLVSIPSFEEQQKIASFFLLIDEKIEKHQKKIEALQLYKKGMLQKVYSQKIRFKDDNGQEFSNWKYDTLGKFASKITKKNKDGKITNVISNSAKEGLIAQRDYFDKDIANIDNIDGYYVIEQGDFVYNPRKSADAPYGPINKYLFKDKGIVSPLYLCFKVSKSIDSDFLAYYFKSDKWHRFIHENSDQGARHDRVSIKDSDFFKMTIPIPEIKEQQKIAKFFRTLDKKIQSEQMRLNILTEWKKGLLQKMFV